MFILHANVVRCQDPMGDLPPMGRKRDAARSGFSLIELVLCIGIILLLLSLALPMLSRSIRKTKATKEMVSVQQVSSLMALYVADWKECYPTANYPIANYAAVYFYKPLIDGDYLRSKEDLGEAAKRAQPTNLIMSRALLLDPGLMVPGRTVPDSEQKTRSIRASQVVEPAMKGSLRLISIDDGRSLQPWCCIPNRPRGPVAFCDGSISEFRWDELLTGELYVENGIGSPVCTTWFGARGRDRQR
jgi:prepilin-type N-terminal cleavage/methylation domain-containing protein